MPLSPIELTDKKNARLYFLQKRALLCPDQKLCFDAQICDGLYSAVAGFDTVLCFCAVRGEPSLEPLVARLLEEGRRVAFPISHTQSTRLEFKLISSLSELSAGAYGIGEPPSANEAVCDFAGAVCLTPALAIDKRGYRLGYGKGYYDRFFEGNDVHRIGVIYSCCMAEELPRESTDIPVDIIVTEKGTSIIS